MRSGRRAGHPLTLWKRLGGFSGIVIERTGRGGGSVKVVDGGIWWGRWACAMLAAAWHGNRVSPELAAPHPAIG